MNCTESVSKSVCAHFPSRYTRHLNVLSTPWFWPCVELGTQEQQGTLQGTIMAARQGARRVVPAAPQTVNFKRTSWNMEILDEGVGQEQK
jgi:hypothetical protein